MITPTPDFPIDLPAADTDDPAKPWRVMDASGSTLDYGSREGARRALYAGRGSAAVYDRKNNGDWDLYETLLREG